MEYAIIVFRLPPDRLNIRRLRRNVTNLVIPQIHERVSLEGPQPLQVTNQVGWDAPLGSSVAKHHHIHHLMWT